MSIPPFRAGMSLMNPDGTPSRQGIAFWHALAELTSSNEARIAAEAADRQAADAALQTGIDAEAATRAAADTAEADARAAADTVLQEGIDAEATARASADTALQGNIDAEASARVAADAALQSGIDALGTILTATAALDFPSIAAGASADLTITVAGAIAGDAVALGLPASPAAGLFFTGFVSADDTVTIRAVNVTAGALDPGSATYRATVFQA